MWAGATVNPPGARPLGPSARAATRATYTYGAEPGRHEGRAGPAELVRMAQEYGEFRVYVVEVCQGCGWNHLTVSAVLGLRDQPSDL